MASLLKRQWLLYAIATQCVLLMGIAMVDAVAWYGHPICDVLVDPGAVVSNLGAARAQGTAKTLHFPDHILSVDGQPLAIGGASPRARVWDEAVEAAAAAGRQAVTATVSTQSGMRVVELDVRRLEPLWWWVLAAAWMFAGALYILAGLIALWASPRSPLSRTFCKLGVATGLVLGLSFDFHTTRVLTPFFFMAFALMPVGWMALPLRLPDDARVLRRAPWLERALEAVGLLTGACFLALYYTGHETLALQRAWSLVMAGAVVFAVTALLVRFVYASGARRQRLRALLVTVGTTHIGASLLLFPGIRAWAILTFATLSLFPLSTAYAFIRYDLWGSRQLLSRILTRIGVGGVACALAILAATALAAQAGVKFAEALLAAGLGGVVATAVVLAALGLVDRSVFYSRLTYKPTVAQLSEELISIASPEEVARAIERTIRRWLPCELVHLSLLPAIRGDAAAAGESASLDRPLEGDVEHLSLLVEFGGVRLGRLRVGEKAGNALFTEDDLDLLQTIANQGALALAHAYAYRELEARRREQAAAWKDERAAVVETVAAEIAHEIRYPINFFRSVFGTAGRQLDSEDIEIGREEVDRLERLVAGLRRLASHALERKRVRLVTLCERVETLLRDDLGGRKLQLAVPVMVALNCDPDQATQILVNLVANGLQAAGADGAVGVAWSQGEIGAELVVWDTGPGFEGEPSRLFAPWYTTKPKGTGLGLAITHRLVRAHGWSITAQCRDNRTLFMIAIRKEDVIERDEPKDDSNPSAEVA
jgi:signal transduction histidine kinase